MLEAILRCNKLFDDFVMRDIFYDNTWKRPVSSVKRGTIVASMVYFGDEIGDLIVIGIVEEQPREGEYYYKCFFPEQGSKIIPEFTEWLSTDQLKIVDLKSS